MAENERQRSARLHAAAVEFLSNFGPGAEGIIEACKEIFLIYEATLPESERVLFKQMSEAANVNDTNTVWF